MLRILLTLFIIASCAHAQDVRITEFLPVNTTGLNDEDGTPQPWIELWNPSPTAVVTLTSGWRLVHAGTQWFFPIPAGTAGIQIPPDSYLVVFADGKNRTTATAPLHTNFTLSSSGGGPLQLVRNDSSVASTYTSYPALAANVSYGRDRVDINQVGSYSNPSPGESNNYTGPGVSGKVNISLSSRAFTGSLSVSLTEASPAAGAVIRYTTSGAVPTSLSPIYTGAPINVSTTIQLRARVFEPGKLPGETETAGYLLLDSASAPPLRTSDFSAATPIVVVSNFGAGAIPDTTDQAAFMWVWEKGADGRARFTDLPAIATRCVVDRRGSSTINNAKTNFNLEARKARDDDDSNISLLGMAPESDWVFHAPFSFDRSLLHNPFAFALSNSVGRYASRNRMAQVFVEISSGSLSGTTNGDYYGLYNVLEKIRRNNERVDITNLREYDNDDVKKTGGYIWKIDRQDPGDGGFSAGGQTLAYYDPKEVEIETPQRQPQRLYLTSEINAFVTALNGPNYRDPTVGYAKYLDVPAAIDHHLLNVWTFNVDALRLSGYMHKERGGKIVYGPLWDFDRALFSTDGRDANPATWRSQSGDLGTDFFNYPWWGRMFTDPDFYQKYIDRWFELRRGALSPATVNALLDALNAEIGDEAVGRDLTRWGQGKRAWTSPFTGTFYPATPAAAGQTAEVQRIKDWLQQRANFFETQWVKPPVFSNEGGNITPGLTLTMTVPVGRTIYYTLDGSDPRPSGGALPTGANVFTYTGPITINSTTRVKARAYDPSPTWTPLIGANNPPLASRWSGLMNARFSTDALPAAANLAITEVNFHPSSPTAAELTVNPVFDTSDFEFVELKNTGTTPIDLNEVELAVGARFTFTNDIAPTLQPGEFLIISANPSAFAVRYPGIPNVFGPFAGDLSNAGEQLVIKAADDSTIVDFTYADNWYPLSDGAGRTLEARTPLGTGYTAPFWRASFREGGSPGFEDIPVNIEQHPLAQTVNPGTPVTLSVVATGQPSPVYQWRRNQEPIPGATSATYEIGPISEAQEGTYDVLVQNVGGTAQSNPAFISVNDPIVFTGHPASQTVNPGTVVTLKAEFTGTGPFTYQWRKGGEPIVGETGAELVITATEAAEGVYDVVVNNIVGTNTSNAANLLVNEPVVITTHPVAQTVNPGIPLTLSVAGMGTAPISYQWRKNGEPIEGATNFELPLAGSEADEAVYDVIVSNVVGPVTSNPANIVVNDPIVITNQPLSQAVNPGTEVTLLVGVTGTGPITYQWRKNNVAIEGQTGSSLVIVATEQDQAVYDVIVTNVVGIVPSNPANLMVNDPLVIETHPVGGVVNPGTPIMLTVAATGTDPITYQWRRNGQAIPGADESSLDLGGVTEANQGDYDVVVTNVVGSVTSNVAVLDVNDPVQITQQPAGRAVNLGVSATFAVTVTGTAPLTYQWRKNGTPIDQATEASYTIPAVSEGNLGNYDVTITNIVGTVTSAVAPLSIIDWNAAAGNYQGLLQLADVSDPASNPRPGRVTATVTKTGKVSGKLDYFGVSHRFSTMLDVNLQGTATVVRKNAPPVTLTVYLDGAAKSVEVTARHSASPAEYEASGDAPQIPKRTATTPPPARMGRYTLLLQPTTGAPVDLTAPGFLTVNITKSGNTTWLGKLPDLTPLKGSAWITPGDEVAFYSALYGGRAPQAGHVSGSLTFGPQTASGDFAWNKPPQLRGEFWPGGLNAFIAADGSRYLPPGRGARVVSAPTMILRIEGPAPAALLERGIFLSQQNIFSFPPNSEKLKMKLNVGTGAMIGSYFDFSAGKARKLEGVLLQNVQEFHGLFPGTGATGTWSVTAP